MRCTRCGGPGPVRSVRLHRHVGLLVIFFHAQIRGEMCRACLDRSFGDAFWLTLVGGWWGLISFFATLFFVPYDLTHYLLTRRSYAAEPDTGSGARMAMAIGVGAMGVLTPMCVGPYLLLAGLSAWVAPLASGTSAPTARAVTVCEGGVDDEAPLFDRAAPHAVAFSRVDGAWRGTTSALPEAWTGDPTTIVVCIDAERQDTIETCASGARRITYPRDVRLVEAHTGREVTRFTVSGVDAPGECSFADTLPTPATARLSGGRVQDAQIAHALQTLTL